MKITQLNARYLPLEDRLVLNINTNENKELSFLLTRRMVKGMMNALAKICELDVTVQQQQTESQKKAVMGFQHQAAISGVDLTTEYKKEPIPPSQNQSMLGDEPMLMQKFKLSALQEGGGLMVIEGVNDKIISLKLHENLLHSLYLLLEKTAVVAEWDIPSAFEEVDTTNKIIKH